MHNWARTQTREPPLPLACIHLFHTTSGHSQFAYLLIVALPPFPILPLGVKHSISDLCWASLLSLYLVSMNKDRSKQKDVIVCLTARLRKSHDCKHGHPIPKQGFLLLTEMEADLWYLLEDANGIWKKIGNDFITLGLNHTQHTLYITDWSVNSSCLLVNGEKNTIPSI